MANKEHLAILKQGVNAWNQWRRENPLIRPDLSEAYLIRALLIKSSHKKNDAFDKPGAKTLGFF